MKYCIVLYLTQLLRDNINEKQFDKLYEFYCIYRRVVIKYIYNYKHSSANIYGTYKQYHYNLKEAGSFEIE